MAMWEFAPGSPWNAIFCLVVFIAVGLRGVRRMSMARQSAARESKVLRCINTEGNRVHDRHVDSHTCFEQPQLLELFTSLERRRRQRDEFFQRLPPIRIEADVMIERPLAIGGRSAGEIERAQAAGRDGGANDLVNVGIGQLFSSW